MYRSFTAILSVATALAGCGGYGGYKPSDRDSRVPYRERLPAAQCPGEHGCQYLSNDPCEAATRPEARARFDACVAREQPGRAQ